MSDVGPEKAHKGPEKQPCEGPQGAHEGLEWACEGPQGRPYKGPKGAHEGPEGAHEGLQGENTKKNTDLGTVWA